MKTADKHILYTVADASSRRTSAASSGTNWLKVITTIINTLLVLAIIFELFWIVNAIVQLKTGRPIVKKKEKKKKSVSEERL